MISPSEIKVGIVAEQGLDIWSAITCLKQGGCLDQYIIVKYVPQFQLALGALFFAEYTDVDGVIILAPENRVMGMLSLMNGVVQIQIQWNMVVAIGGRETASNIVEMIAMQNDMELNAPENVAAPRIS